MKQQFLRGFPLFGPRRNSAVKTEAVTTKGLEVSALAEMNHVDVENQVRTGPVQKGQN